MLNVCILHECSELIAPSSPLQITSPFLPGNFQNFVLVNRQRSTRITTGFTVEMSIQGPQLSYRQFDQLGQESFYWQLPENYQGDKVTSCYVEGSPGSIQGRLHHLASKDGLC